MSDSPNKGASDAPLGSPTLTFRGGGWVVALAAFLVVLVLVWSLLGVMIGRRPIGDGTNLESYGFNLSNLTIDRTQLNGSGHPLFHASAHRVPSLEIIVPTSSPRTAFSTFS